MHSKNMASANDENWKCAANAYGIVSRIIYATKIQNERAQRAHAYRITCSRKKIYKEWNTCIRCESAMTTTKQISDKTCNHKEVEENEKSKEKKS